VCTFAIAAWIGPRRSKRSSRRVSVFGNSAFRIMSALMTLTGVVLVVGALVLVAMATSTRNDALMLNAGEIALMGTGVLAVRTLARLSP